MKEKIANRDQDESAEATQERRAILKAMLGGGAALIGAVRSPIVKAAAETSEEEAHARFERATRGMSAPRITDLKVIQVGGGGANDSTVVKVTTNQAGLYGWGCATTTFPGGRSRLVPAAVEDYLKPLLVGRTVDRIEQIWQLAYMSSYYKNDTILNCAIGGVCDALWDIKGRQAGMPVYQLAGGKCRDAADIYLHANLGAADPARQFVENAQKLVAGGCRNILAAMFVRDGATMTLNGQPRFEDGSIPFDRDKEIGKILTAFEAFRKEMPSELKLGVDVHSLLDSIRAVEFAKRLEPLDLFYCEDLLAPEEAGHYAVVREQTATPLAIGELWNNPSEWRPLVERRQIDYVRHHVSHIGGFTAARRIAAFIENYEVKFAWHGAPNSPVGHMTNVTLDITNENFGVHEHFDYPPVVQDIFQGHLQVADGYAWVSEKPGWGIEVDEALAAKHPIRDERPNEIRTPDGSVIQGTG